MSDSFPTWLRVVAGALVELKEPFTWAEFQEGTGEMHGRLLMRLQRRRMIREAGGAPMRYRATIRARRIAAASGS